MGCCWVYPSAMRLIKRDIRVECVYVGNQFGMTVLATDVVLWSLFVVLHSYQRISLSM